MRLLIIDDNTQLAKVTATLLRQIDQGSREIETISSAADLDAAMRLLPQHDAVLCDGQFPVSPNFCYRDDQWMAVHREAVNRGMLFILYSGSPESLSDATSKGVPTIAKPCRIEKLYQVLLEHWRDLRPAAVSFEARH
jgi:CheY-like chemotaxis protein